MPFFRNTETGRRIQSYSKSPGAAAATKPGSPDGLVPALEPGHPVSERTGDAEKDYASPCPSLWAEDMRLSAKQFSLKYIQIIDDVLDVGQVSPNPRAESKVEELSDRLGAHFSIWQIGALESIQERNDSVAFHFGNSDDLSKTLEYAPLYVDHVVLQDLIYRILQDRGTAGKKLMEIRPIAEQLVSWRPLVEEGRVSLVPSPLSWDDRIENHLLSLSPSNHQFAVPLYASVLLGCSPMTDVPALARRLPDIAMSSVGQGVADVSATANRLRSTTPRHADSVYYRNRIAELQHGDVVDVLPLLLGNERVTKQPELWCLKDPDTDELLRLSADFRGFRDELNDIVNRVSTEEDVADIYDMLKSASERAESEYEMMKRERARYRRSLGKESVKVVLQSLPLVFGLSHHEMLASLLGTASSAGLLGAQFQELYEKWNQGLPNEDNALFRTFTHFEGR